MSVIQYVYNKIGSSSGGGGGSSTPVYPTLRADGSPDNYDLVFFDEFNGPSLDRSRWCTRYQNAGGPALTFQGGVADAECNPTGGGGPGTLDFLPGNSEQQRYRDFDTEGTPMHQFGTEGGATFLKLMATKVRPDPGFNWALWESGMVRSKITIRPTGNEAYFLCARMRLPNVKGSWPAFWLATALNPDGSQTWPPEIDIMEGVLNDSTEPASQYQCSFKWPNVGGEGVGAAQPKDFQSDQYNNMWGGVTRRSGASWRGEWHTWWCHWTAKHVTLGIDNQVIFRGPYEWKSNAGAVVPEAYILLNFAVGGPWAGKDGIGTEWPASFDIDYVRVYKRIRTAGEVAAEMNNLGLML